MRITLVCSCGLLMESSGQKLLVDAPNSPLAPFYAFPDQELQKLISAQPPYDGALALAFTHAHEDHLCREKLRRVLDARPQTKVLLPDHAFPDTGEVHLGDFCVEFHRFAHIAVPKNLMTDHFVLLVKCGGEKVYITADATPDAERHRMVLAGRRCDVAFWNGLHLSYVETRTLMREAAEKNYVYHVPVDPADTSGIRRKCERNMQRFASELAGVVVLDRYPAVLCPDAREGEST